MATGQDEDYCVPCSFRDTNIKAANWCVTCQEGLCDGCKRYHEKSKFSQNHTVVVFRNRNDLPEIFENISEKCIEHNKQYEIFCPDHQAVCCVNCSLIDHNLCTNLAPLDNITQSIKTSVAKVNLGEGLQGLVSKIDTIVFKKEQAKTLLLSQMHSISESLSNFKTQMIESFERSSNYIEEEMNQANVSYDSKTSSVLKKLQTRRDKIIQRVGALAQVKRNSSNLKFIIVLRELEQFLNHEDDELSAILEGRDFEDMELEFIPRDDIANYLTQTKNLGDLVKKTTKIDIEARAAGQVATLGEENDESNGKLKIKNLDDLKLQKKLEITFPQPCRVTSSTILPNKLMIFADCCQSRLLLFDQFGEFMRQINTKAPPRDLIVYDQSSIAVTLSAAKKVVRIESDTNENKVVQEINVPGECKGIDVHQRQLIVTVKGYGILIYNKPGRAIRTITVACVSLSCSKTNIYYLNGNFLRCCDYYGTPLWETKVDFSSRNHENNSISVVDKQGNVLVSDFQGNSVYSVALWKKCKKVA